MISAWWILGFYLLERGGELLIARRNRRRLLSLGAKEYFPETYRSIVLLHSLFFLSLVLEGWPWRLPVDALTLFCLIALALLQGLRYWCIVSLGMYWNTRILVLPGARVPRRGPYRWLRHPNYVVVTLEIALLPLLMRAPLTLLLFTLANLALLRRRIRLEEEALRRNTDYSQKFGRHSSFGKGDPP